MVGLRAKRSVDVLHEVRAAARQVVLQVLLGKRLTGQIDVQGDGGDDANRAGSCKRW